MYTDETLTCTDCGAPFVFTAGEAQFFATKGFQNKPSRCADCRAVRKASRGSGRAERGGPRRLFAATCSSCGAATEVPFQPRGDRPVYCKECFARTRSAPE